MTTTTPTANATTHAVEGDDWEAPDWDGWQSSTLRSTTGSAPIHFERTDDPETFRIVLEDGSSQVYGRTEILSTLLNSGVLLPSPKVTFQEMIRVALALGVKPSELYGKQD